MRLRAEDPQRAPRTIHGMAGHSSPSSIDAALREQLGRAGHAWWQRHATPAHAAAAWSQILQEAATLAPPPRPDDWPAQLGADGTELARAILGEFGLTSDV